MDYEGHNGDNWENMNVFGRLNNCTVPILFFSFDNCTRLKEEWIQEILTEEICYKKAL